MWGQVSMQTALRAFLNGRAVKVADFNADTILDLSEVFQRFADGTVFFTETVAVDNLKFSEAVEEMTEDLAPLAQNIEQVNEMVIENISASVTDAPDQKEDKATRRKKQLEKSEADYQKRKITDIGKLRALKAAGWPNTKIADEFGCTSQTVANTLAKLKKLEEAQA